MARGEQGPLEVAYDLSQEELWSLGIGCNGSIWVFVESLTDALFEFLQQASGRAPLARVIDLESGRWERVPTGTLECKREGSLFQQVICPAPAVYVFGAGHDAVPLVDWLSDAGSYVTVVDPRPAFVTRERFPSASDLRVLRVEQAADLEVEEGGFGVLMRHQKERDQQWLRIRVHKPLRYIGMLGPYGQTVEVLEGLGLSLKDERFYYPVGLDLGAERPEAVAISIAGELLAVHRGRKGGSLRWNDQPIHS